MQSCALTTTAAESIRLELPPMQNQPRPDTTARWRSKLRCERLLGRSAALAAVLEQAAAAAALRDATVVITGPAGSGKTLLARVIHENSSRSQGPFVECDAASQALSRPAAAQEGLARAAATARGGSLLVRAVERLDETSQASLLRLLRTTPTPGSALADVRVMAASSVDLAAAQRAGSFRRDLFFQLDVLRVSSPSLAERSEDIAELATSFLTQIGEREGLTAAVFAPAALQRLQAASWPGNVRQLWAAVDAAARRAAIDQATVVELRHLPAGESVSEDSEDGLSWQAATRRFQRELLERTLAECDGNVTEVARRLGLVRSHVYARMKSFGLGGK